MVLLLRGLLAAIFAFIVGVACAQGSGDAKAGPISAQTDDLHSNPRLSPPKDASADTLNSYFQDQVRLLEKGLDYKATLRLYKAWNAALPKDKVPKEKLLLLLADGKQYDSAITFDQPHFDAPDDRYSGQLKMALDLYFSGRDEEVLTRATKIMRDAQKEHVYKYSGNTSGWSPFRASSAALGLAGAFELQTRVLLRNAKFRQALGAAEDGIDAAIQAVGIVKDMPPNEVAAAAAFQSKETLASLLLQKIRAQMATGYTYGAARTLDEYLPIAREIEVHPRHFWNIAVVRYNQRSFKQAEQYFRKAEDAANSLGYPILSFFRVDCAQGIVGALEGQRKWREAKLELERLDALAGDDETLQYRIRYRFERGYAYVRAGIRLEDALILLQELADRPTDGLFAAHAMGLRGVVLWRLQRDPAQALAGC